MASTSANSGVDIASRALILIGADPITSFDSDTTEALVALNLYEDMVRTALCNSRWRFSTNQAVMNRLSDVHTGRFDQAYQLPNGTLMVHAVTVNDLRIDYSIYTDKIYANTSDTDQLVVDYTYRVGEENFPPYFTLALEYAIASAFALSIARDDGMAQMLERKAQMLMQQARTLDAQQQTARKLATSRFITNRRS